VYLQGSEVSKTFLFQLQIHAMDVEEALMVPQSLKTPVNPSNSASTSLMIRLSANPAASMCVHYESKQLQVVHGLNCRELKNKRVRLVWLLCGPLTVSVCNTFYTTGGTSWPMQHLKAPTRMGPQLGPPSGPQWGRQRPLPVPCCPEAPASRACRQSGGIRQGRS
jgi:hypothetical protein